ncbi:uncharacterized protein [Patagioenas fasciata]
MLRNRLPVVWTSRSTGQMLPPEPSPLGRVAAGGDLRGPGFPHLQCGVLDSASRLDEEHKLIARYAARLAAETSSSQQGQQRGASDISFTVDANKQQRQLIAELENKNREIPQEIQRLRLGHEQAPQPTPEKAQHHPTLRAELRLLRPRKEELEQRMSALQESPRELMVQLEGLMKLLKLLRHRLLQPQCRRWWHLRSGAQGAASRFCGAGSRQDTCHSAYGVLQCYKEQSGQPARVALSGQREFRVGDDGSFLHSLCCPGVSKGAGEEPQPIHTASTISTIALAS